MHYIIKNISFNENKNNIVCYERYIVNSHFLNGKYKIINESISNYETVAIEMYSSFNLINIYLK